MIQIAICEDEMNARTELRMLVEACLEKNRYSYRIYEFGKGEEVLDFGTCFHGIFLDIEMGGMSGFDVKEWLESEKSDAFIVFVTSHEEQMQEAFGENVVGFIKKPAIPQDVTRVLEKVMVHYRDHQKVLVKSEEGINEIEVKDILYIKGDHVYVDIYLCGGNQRITRDKLHIWEEKLEQYGFCRIHKSYLVNMGRVHKVTKHEVTMQDGTKLAVGRKFEYGFWEKYHRYRKDRARYV